MKNEFNEYIKEYSKRKTSPKKNNFFNCIWIDYWINPMYFYSTFIFILDTSNTLFIQRVAWIKDKYQKIIKKQKNEKRKLN